MVPIEYIFSHPMLDHLEFLDVFLSVRVPHSSGILYQGTNKTEVGLLPDGDSADVQIPFQEAYSLVCFHAYILNMGIPLEILCQCDT